MDDGASRARSQLAADVAGLLEEYDVIRREGFLEGQCEVRPGEAAGDAAGGGAPGEPAGRTIGANRLVSPISQGGMGVVWLGERCDGQFEGLAAVKLLTIRFGRSDARFRREANILARVTHPDTDQLITTFPTGTHWGGDWVVGLDGLFYVDQQRPGTVAIDFLPFGGPSLRPVHAFRLTAPAARNIGTFAIAPDESWLVWSQDDYRNTDIMMIAHRP